MIKFFKKLFQSKSKCEKCGSKKLEDGYWRRGWNNLCNQAYGDYGKRCYDCGMIVWNETLEEHLKTLPNWCTPHEIKLN